MFKKVAIAIILLQISFAIVNLTGVFTVRDEMTMVDSEKITAQKELIVSKSENKENVLDYFKVLGAMIYLGFTLTVSFLKMIFTATPSLLKLFMVPNALANLIGFAVDALVILGIAYKLFMR